MGENPQIMGRKAMMMDIWEVQGYNIGGKEVVESLLAPTKSDHRRTRTLNP